MTSIGVNVTCNTNCSKWCPRALHVTCCCLKTSDDDIEDIEDIEKVKRVANPIISGTSKNKKAEN